MKIDRKRTQEKRNNGSYTCAICVGVGKYESPAISNLKFSDTDAVLFAEMMHEFGVLDTTVLTNENATRKNILDQIGKQVPLKYHSVTGSKRLIVFFSGHGWREEVRGNLPKSILLTYDTDGANKGLTGISLQDLIDVISRSEPDEVFIFIDACSVQFDSMPNIFTETSTECEVFVASKAKHLFAYVASAQKVAFENNELGLGVFTECLIRNIKNIQTTGGTISDLTTAIRNEITIKGMQNPFYFSMGNEETWMFESANTDSKEKSTTHQHKNMTIKREKLFAQLHQKILESPKPIYIVGESGVGKSTIARHLISSHFDGVYLSIPESPEATIQSVISDLVYQTINVFPSGRPLESIDSTLDYYRKNNQNQLIVIDHTERNEGLTRNLFDKFKEFSLNIVLVGRKAVVSEADCIIWPCPKLSENEVSMFLSQFKLEEKYLAADLLQKCNGLPIKLVEILNNTHSVDDVDESHCIKVLSATGGYVDERIFKTVFSIKQKTVDRLINSGKIIMLEDRYVPHDSIMNFSHNIENRDIYCYWDKQILNTPTHSWACKKFISFIVENNDIPQLQRERCFSLDIAINKLFELKDWELLKVLINQLILWYPNQHDALLLLAKIFVHRSNYGIVDEIVHVVQQENLTQKQCNLLNVIQAEKFWWIGEYNKTKSICQKMLKSSIDEQLMYECKMHIGIAEFFLGNWEAALQMFSFTNDIFNTATPQVNAWALYLSATIVGLRGTNISKGKEQFFAGIRLLQQIRDDSGIASAWGNMAEMNWKLRDYEVALMQAKRGYNIAKQTDHIIDQIEIARTILNTEFRLYSPYDPCVAETKKIIEDLISDDIGETVNMQIWNTFATLCAYQGDVCELKRMIEIAFPHTCNNREYHIYTLANLCLLKLFEENLEESQTCYYQALQMAIEGNNFLAIRQMHDDIMYINTNFNSPVTNRLYNLIKSNINKYEKSINNQLKEPIL